MAPIGPSDIASGDTCPIHGPLVPPENLPSVMSPTFLICIPASAEVGFNISLIPGPPLGPSNLRDTLSIPFNWYASPTSYLKADDSSAFINWLSVGITSFAIMNEVSFQTKTLDEIYYNTPNLYPFLRDAYEKRRMEMAK